MSKKTTVLMILDGFGLNANPDFNAVDIAKTPNFDQMIRTWPFAKGSASGLDVGLPDGQMGNSEVGHLNIGAGRIVYQDLTKITKAIQDGDFFTNPALMDAVENCRQHGGALHLMGLLSDGGVHSHIEHLYGLLELARRNGLKKVYVHGFMDGRDTPPSSGIEYVRQLEEKMKELGVGEIATLSGRYYAMDRDNRWEREEKAYAALVYGEGNREESAHEVMRKSYAEGVTDEFVVPCVIVRDGQPVGKIQAHDSVIFFNFRPDRARQLTRAFCDDGFTGFQRKRIPVTFVCFTDYDATIANKEVAFQKERLKNILGEYVARHGMRQLRLAETEKYAHVTFFFNGGVEVPNENEDRILVPSPKVATYDLQPEMSAVQVCDKLVEALDSRQYDLIVINFANPDMVGHTGILEAAVKAVETVDQCLGRALEAIERNDAQMFLCADHGNAEQLKDYKTGEPFTAHTTNPVPFVLVGFRQGITLRDGGRLADIAPTLLDMMGLPKPQEMTGTSLLIRG